MKNAPKTRLAAALAFAFTLFIGYYSVHSPDTWRDLRTGREIAETGRLPDSDPFSYTAAGAPWSAPDWLSHYFFYQAHSAGGDRAVVGVKALIVAAAFTLTVGLAGGDAIIALGVLALAACGAWTGLTEQPFVFDLLFVAVLLRLLRSSGRFSFKLMAATAVTQALWANFHAAGAWLGVAVVSIQALKSALKTERKQRFGWLGLAAVSAAVLFTNPHGGGALARGLGAVPWDGGAHLLNLYGVFLVATVAGAWVCLQDEFFLGLSALVLMAASLVSPAARAPFFLAASPLVAVFLGRYLEPGEATRRRWVKLGGVLVLLFLAYVVNVGGSLGRWKGFTTRQTADGAVAFLEAAGVQGRMFNDLDSAPSLIWRAPSRAVFADDRPEVFEPDVLEDARRWFERWRTLDGIYRFDYAVVANHSSGYPCRAIDEDPGWALAYWDDASLVYLRKAGPGGPILRRGAYRWLKPNRLFSPVDTAVERDPGALAEALAEAERAEAQAPGAASPRLIRAWLLDLAGRGNEATELLERTRRLLWKPEHYARLAWVLERRGSSAQAWSAYRRARTAAARAGDRRLESAVHARIGGLHRAQGRLWRARRSFERALDLDPEDHEAALALKSL